MGPLVVVQVIASPLFRWELNSLAVTVEGKDVVWVVAEREITRMNKKYRLIRIDLKSI
jgi:hypothetical protein